MMMFLPLFRQCPMDNGVDDEGDGATDDDDDNGDGATDDDVDKDGDNDVVTDDDGNGDGAMDDNDDRPLKTNKLIWRIEMLLQ